MDKAQVVKFAKEAGLLSTDSEGFDHMQGDMMKFVAMIAKASYDEGYSEGADDYAFANPDC